MKKTFTKICALLLCAVVFFSSAAPCLAAALPEGITEQDVIVSIPKLDIAVKSLMSQSEAFSDPSAAVYGMLFSDDTLNSLLTGVYSALAENESTFSMLGLDISVARVARELTSYTEVYDYLTSKQTWSEVVSGGMKCRWNVKTKEKFAHAAAGIFAPLSPLLYTLLCGGRYKVNALVYVDGDMGYANAVVPLFQALGCPSIMSQEEFSAQAKTNYYTMVKNILSMLYSSLDAILASPVDKLCTVLPSLAYFMQNGGVSSALDSLIAPMKVQVGLFQLSGLDKILESTGMFSNASALTDMLEGLDLSALTGGNLKLDLPDFDMAALSACCTYSNGVYTVNKAQSLCEILRWTLKMLRQNKKTLLSQLGGGMTADASGFIDGLLAKSDDEIIKLVFEILNMRSDDTVLEYKWTYPDFTPGAVTYTPNLTVEEYTKVLNEIDDTLNEFLTEFGDGSLSSTLAGTIYSNSLVTTLVKSLYGALYSEETSALLGMLGLDASPEGVSNMLSRSYPTAARRISSALKWENVNENTVSWGFYNGNREGFENALVAVLRPLIPFLDLLLSEGKITLLGAIEISGSNGYNTAVIPILEGLGCRDIQAYSQYKAAGGTDNALRYILDPVCDLLDELIEKPVATICEILPNLIYFVNSGGIKQCVDNLMHPVNVLLEKFGMTGMMPQSFSELGNIDVASLVSQLSENGTLPFKLPAPDLTLVSSLGTAEKYDSKRTYNGLFTDYTYIRADAPAVLVTVLRYFIGALSDPENGGGLESLMGGDAMEGNDMFAMYAGNITEQFKTMTVDEIIEWLYNLLFRETPKKEIETKDEFIPTIIYQAEPDHTARNRAILITAAILLPTLLVIYLAKRDVNAKKEKKQRKKLKKQAEKAAKKTGAVTAKDVKQKNAAAEKAAKELSDAKAKAQRYAERERLAAQAGAAREKKAEKRQRLAAENNVSAQIDELEEKPVAGLHEKIEKDRELAKLRARQEKAAKKAMRDARKADKYYEQAVREAGRHR